MPDSVKNLLLAVLAVIVLAGAVVAVHSGAPSKASPDTALASPSPSPQPYRIAILGDSYTGGSDIGGQGSKGYPQILAGRLGAQVYVQAVGGSGYTTRGTGSTTFLERAPNIVGDDPQLVIVYGSRNDSTATGGALKAAVTATLTQIVQATSHPKVLVIGPAWGPVPPPGAPDADRAIVRSVATSLNLPFVDPVQQGWFTGTNAHFIGADQVHPTDAGHVHEADLIEATLRRLNLLPAH